MIKTIFYVYLLGVLILSIFLGIMNLVTPFSFAINLEFGKMILCWPICLVYVLITSYL